MREFLRGVEVVFVKRVRDGDVTFKHVSGSSAESAANIMPRTGRFGFKISELIPLGNRVKTIRVQGRNF